ncbi:MULTISPECIES: lipopolysaccharide biosynthesis protein [unclassified Campylobacter]|uniref:lipopolysaccharide biosynthesis protein n=1 Tax=unclassified Campylobacter TaxID=2593542 RepID=UPI003D34518D
MKETSFKKRYVFKLVSSIINAIINTVMVAIVPKYLGPVNYGFFTYFQNFFSQMIGFLDFGSSTAFFTKLSADGNRKSLLVFYTLYIFFIFLICIGFVLVIKFIQIENLFFPYMPHEYIFYGMFFGFLTWLTQICIKISDAYALTVSVEMIKIFHKLSMLGLIFYIVFNFSLNLQSYFIYQFISFGVFLLVVLVVFLKSKIFYDLPRLTPDLFRSISNEFIKFCHPLVVHSVVTGFAAFFDIWLLQKVSGGAEVGFYGLSYSLVAVTFIFSASMTPIITREFSLNYANKNYEALKTQLIKYSPPLYCIAAFFGVFISFHSSEILQIFVDDKFKGATFALSIMAFYPLHQTYGQISNGLLYASSRTNLARNISLYITPFGILISFILIYFFRFGSVGLALKIVLIQIISVNISLYFNTKMLGIGIKFFIYHQIYSVCIFVILAFFSGFFKFFESVLLNFFVFGFFYVCFVIISFLLFPRLLTADDAKSAVYLQRIKSVFKK